MIHNPLDRQCLGETPTRLLSLAPYRTNNVENTHCCTKRTVRKATFCTNKIRNMHFGEGECAYCNAYFVNECAYYGYDKVLGEYS